MSDWILTPGGPFGGVTMTLKSAPQPEPTKLLPHTEHVRQALGWVRANTEGGQEFETAEEVEAFIEAVYDRFPHQGYGTSCYPTKENPLLVRWSVWGCD